MAGIIANKILCPTVQLESSIGIDYESEVFVGGKHTFYITPFNTTDFVVDILYKVDEQVISDYDAKEKIRSTLYQYFLPEVHKDYVREDDVYNVIEALNLAGVTIFSVNLSVDGSTVDYVNVPLSRIPRLSNVVFTREVN